MQITGCDERKERCRIAYYNDDVVVRLTAEEALKKAVETMKDGAKKRVKPKPRFHEWNKVDKDTKFQKWATEQDIFLHSYEVFSNEDTLYLTDSKKKTHLFDLAKGKYLGHKPFEKMYPIMKKIARKNKAERKTNDAPYDYNFPLLKSGKHTEDELAKYLGMKAVKDSKERESGDFRIYMFEIYGTLFRDGSFKVDRIDSENEQMNQKIQKFLELKKFDNREMPKGFEQFHIDGNRFNYRHPNDDVSRKENEVYRIKLEEELKKWKTAEKIRGVYIPLDLEDSFILT